MSSEIAPNPIPTAIRTAPHDTLFHPYGFASQNLMNDLFENLGVVQSEFFLSQGPWSVIPQVSSNS